MNPLNKRKQCYYPKHSSILGGTLVTWSITHLIQRWLLVENSSQNLTIWQRNLRVEILSGERKSPKYSSSTVSKKEAMCGTKLMREHEPGRARVERSRPCFMMISLRLESSVGESPLQLEWSFLCLNCIRFLQVMKQVDESTPSIRSFIYVQTPSMNAFVRWTDSLNAWR